MAIEPGPSTQAVIRGLAHHALTTWPTGTVAELSRWVYRQVTPPEGIVPDQVARVLQEWSVAAVQDAVYAQREGIRLDADLLIRS